MQQLNLMRSPVTNRQEMRSINKLTLWADSSRASKCPRHNTWVDNATVECIEFKYTRLQCINDNSSYNGTSHWHSLLLRWYTRCDATTVKSKIMKLVVCIRRCCCSCLEQSGRMQLNTQRQRNLLSPDPSIPHASHTSFECRNDNKHF